MAWYQTRQKASVEKQAKRSEEALASKGASDVADYAADAGQSRHAVYRAARSGRLATVTTTDGKVLISARKRKAKGK